MPLQLVRGSACALAAMFVFGACGDGPTGGTRPAPSDTTAVISAATLTEGGEGVITGHNLDRIASALVVDGRMITPTSATPSEIRFRMPAGRPCETDRRPVEVRAPGITFAGTLSVASPRQLQPGESVVLSAASLEGCLQLPAGQDFVLSAVVLERDVAVHEVVRLRTYAATADTSVVSTFLSPVIAGAQAFEPVRDHSPSRDTSFAVLDAPLHDPRLATAVPGDPVRMVDWPRSPCYAGTPPAGTRLPEFEAKVIAASGSVVLLVDPRVPAAAAIPGTAQEEILRQAVALADRTALPALRTLFDPAFAPSGAAAGRMFVLVTDWSGAYGSSLGYERNCWGGSHIMIGYLNAKVLTSTARKPGDVAGVIVHELAHEADAVTSIRTGTWTSPNWDEAWAVSAEEVAARLSMGVESGATVVANTPEMHVEQRYRLPIAMAWDESVWRDNYQLGWTLLLYARESLGQATFSPVDNPLWKRIQVDPNVPPGSGGVTDAVARVLGMPADSLLDRWVVAQLTAGKLAPAHADARQTPMLRSWASPVDAARLESWTAVGAEHLATPVAGTAHSLAARGGSFDYVYLPSAPRASGPETVSGGNSVRFFGRVPGLRVIVRLTRLR